jgi:hypothetical protein
MQLRHDQSHTLPSPPTSRPWQPMAVRLVGTVATLVLNGQGKLSALGGDPGEPRKQQGA